MQPSDTAKPGGKETGQKGSHYIVPEGSTGKSRTELGGQAKAKRASKTKYTCPICQQNAWAKPGAALICGNCYDGHSDICVMPA